MREKKQAEARVGIDAERLKVLRYLAFKKGTTVQAMIRQSVKDFLRKQ